MIRSTSILLAFLLSLAACESRPYRLAARDSDRLADVDGIRAELTSDLCALWPDSIARIMFNRSNNIVGTDVRLYGFDDVYYFPNVQLESDPDALVACVLSDSINGLIVIVPEHYDARSFAAWRDADRATSSS